MALYPDKRMLFRTRMLQDPPMPEGLKPLLENLHQTYKLALVTSSGRAEIEPILAAAGLSACFDALVCGREAGALKPAPEPYLLAARLLGASRPLVVEDSEPGLASARAAGFDTVAVSSPDEVSEAVLRTLFQPPMNAD